MPYLQLEIDGKKRIPLVARAVGISPGEVLWGLVELWEFAWLAGSDNVTELALSGCIGPSEVLRDALAAFGFIERLEDGTWRVRGTDRYSKTDEARSRGGKAAAKNLIPGGPHAAAKRARKVVQNGADLGSSSAEPRLQPSASPASGSAEPRVNREPRTENRITLPAANAAAEQQQQPEAAGPSGDWPPQTQEAWAWMQEARGEKGLPPEVRPPRGFAEWEARASAQVGPDGVMRAFQRYLDSPDFARGGWATAVFLRDTVWLSRAGPPSGSRDALTGVRGGA